MGLFNKVTKSAVSAAVDTVSGVLDKGAEIADRFIQSPDEKAAFQLEWKKLQAAETDQAIERETNSYADRQGARDMSTVHGDLQRRFSVIFLIGYLVVIMLDLSFIAFLVWIGLKNPGIDIPQMD